MKYMLCVVLACLVIMCGACKNEEAPAQPAMPPEPAIQYKIDYHDPASIVVAYYQALFYNDMFMAYDFMYERDRWFMFPEDFIARYKLNTFAYPAYVADKFSYEVLSVTIDADRATVTGMVTLPQTAYISTLLGERLFDVSLPPLSDQELREMVDHENWQYIQQTVRHTLLNEDDRWYMFYGFETEEIVVGLLRRAEGLKLLSEMSGLLDAREALTGLTLVT